jgi:transcriptional regulator of heat shock response
MASLYELDALIESLLEQEDPETGELLCDMEQLDAVLMERDAKLENIALYIKNKTAEAEMIKAEKLTLEKRQKVANNKAERAKAFLDEYLKGEKFSTAKVAVSYRKSEQVEVSMAFFTDESNERFLRFKDPEADKAAIKAVLKAGETVPGAEIVSKMNMSIK